MTSISIVFPLFNEEEYAVRAYEAAKDALGPITDDYEIILRTFLATRMCHIRAFGYVQYHNRRHDEPQVVNNTQRARNAEIQRLSHAIKLRYDQRLHDRLLELGCPDFIRGDDGSLDFSRPNPGGLRGAELVYDPM